MLLTPGLALSIRGLGGAERPISALGRGALRALGPQLLTYLHPDSLSRAWSALCSVPLSLDWTKMPTGLRGLEPGDPAHPHLFPFSTWVGSPLPDGVNLFLSGQRLP